MGQVTKGVMESKGYKGTRDALTMFVLILGTWLANDVRRDVDDIHRDCKTLGNRMERLEDSFDRLAFGQSPSGAGAGNDTVSRRSRREDTRN